ncbi:MAG: hypothetical protein AAF756_05040 [Pseudomonadota bacterium]
MPSTYSLPPWKPPWKPTWKTPMGYRVKNALEDSPGTIVYALIIPDQQH